MAALLLDENMPRSAGAALAEAGHDFVHISDTEPAASYRRVLALARESGRVLGTFDADFGVLIYHHGEPPATAILYLRLHAIDGAAAATVARKRWAVP